jgi:hypothetical protein
VPVLSHILTLAGITRGQEDFPCKVSGRGILEDLRICPRQIHSFSSLSQIRLRPERLLPILSFLEIVFSVLEGTAWEPFTPEFSGAMMISSKDRESAFC